MSELALRTRLLGAVLRRTSKPPASGQAMIDLRHRREKLVRSPLGRLVFGRVAPGVVTEERTIDLGGHRSRLLVHRPTAALAPLPVVVNFHGGGWCLGSPEQSAWLASHVAQRTGCLVVSPTYRLAPEHPYPAAVDDAWAALQWIVDHAAELGADPERVAVMGDSAGGNLAAVTALLARPASPEASPASGTDANTDASTVAGTGTSAPRVRAQVLIYPAVELYERYPSEDEYAEGIVLTSRGMRLFTRLYLGERYGTEDWQGSPLRAPSHAGLPPALVLTAHADPLRDNGTRYAAALEAAGVEVESHDYPAGVHGLISVPGVVPVAREVLADICDFLRRRL